MLLKWLFVLLMIAFRLASSFTLSHVRRITSSTIFAGRVGSSLQKAEGLADDMTLIRTQTNRPISLDKDPLLPMVYGIAKSADMRKAANVAALRVGHLTEVTQFVVEIEGSSNRQINAIADTVEVITRMQYLRNSASLKCGFTCDRTTSRTSSMQSHT